MSKTSVVTKLISFAVMIALLIASFPTMNVVAKGNNQGLESKWSQLIDNYNRQSSAHNGVHKWVDHWLIQNKNASESRKSEIMKHLVICNSAIASAGTIVSKHSGFDSNGKVIDKGLAQKSVKDLAFYLRQHAGSINNLKAHIHQE